MKRGLLLAGLLLTACASAPPPPPPVETVEQSAELVAPAAPVIPERAAQQFAQAVALLEANRLTDAELELKQLALAYPQFAAPQLNLGLLYERAGKLPEAEQALKDALQRDPASAVAATELGVVYRKLGRFRDAQAAYAEALRIDPDFAAAHLNLGVLCDLYLQDPARALQAFERYQELSGNSDKRVANWIAELKSRLGSNPQSPATGSPPQTAEAAPQSEGQ